MKKTFTPKNTPNDNEWRFRNEQKAMSALKLLCDINVIYTFSIKYCKEYVGLYIYILNNANNNKSYGGKPLAQYEYHANSIREVISIAFHKLGLNADGSKINNVIELEFKRG